MATNFGHYLYLSGGMNAAFEPAGLQEDQYAVGINVVSRSGSIAPRPDYQRMRLEFEFESDRYLFEHGRFQGAVTYAIGGSLSVVCVISGAIFLVNLVTGFTRQLSTESAYLDENVQRCYLAQVEKFIVIQDGVNLPIIVQGGNAKVAEPAPKGPRIGTVMAYGHGRLFTKIGPRAISAGDINRPNDEEAVLRSYEHVDLAIGGAFAVGEDLGEIMAMTFANNYDTTSGDGPLLVGTKTGLVTFRVDLNRDDWLTSVFSKVQVRGTGITGPNALTGLNADTLFWSPEGLRSLAVLQAEVHDARRYVNVSRDVQPLYANEPEWFKPFISLGVANGRLLSTVGGRTVDAESRSGDLLEDLCFDGMFALDFDRIAVPTRRTGTSPTVAYDGIWTGLPVTEILTTDTGVVLFGKRGVVNVICKVTQQTTGNDDFTPIRCRLFTRSFVTKAPPDYEDAPFQQKKFEAAYIWAKQVTGAVPIKLWLSVDGSPAFCKISEMILDSPMVEWDGHGIPEIGESRGFSRSPFPSPEFQCDPSTGRSLLSGYDFQFCIEWEGMFSFSRFLFHTSQIPETSGVHCLDQATLLNLSRFSTDPEVAFLADENLSMYPGDVIFDNIQFRQTQDVDPGPGHTDAFVWPAGYPAFAAIWDKTVVYGGEPYSQTEFPALWPVPWPFKVPRFPGLPVGYPYPGDVSDAVPTSIVAGRFSTFFFMSDGSLLACGNNTEGTLGFGSGSLNMINDVPKQVLGGGEWDQLSAGVHTLAIRDGRLYATGLNFKGQLGLGDTVNRSELTQVGTESDWDFVFAANDTSFGIRAGKLYAWGDNDWGQLGLGDAGAGTERNVPTQVGVATDWEKVSYNGTVSAGIRAGKLFTWGTGFYGQLGDGSSGAGAIQYTPAQIGAFTDWSEVAHSTWSCFGIRNSGWLYSWGMDSASGVLGQGVSGDLTVPTRIGVATDWSNVSAGESHCCALRTGTLWFWGWMTYLGGPPGVRQDTPLQVGVETDWSDVQTMQDGVLGQRANAVYSWGIGYFGELAYGLASIGPVPIVTTSPVEIPFAWELTAQMPSSVNYGEIFNLTINAIDRTGTGRVYNGAGALLSMFPGSEEVDLDAGAILNVDPTTGWVANVWTKPICANGAALLGNNIDRITVQAATRSPLQPGVCASCPLVLEDNYWPFVVDTIGAIRPWVRAPLLLDADVTWTRPDMTTFTGQYPASALFSMTGLYMLSVSDWSKVEKVSFLAALAVSGNVGGWRFEEGLQELMLWTTNVSGDVSAWVFPSTMFFLNLYDTNVEGDIGGWILPVILQSFTVSLTNLTGDVSNWILADTLYYFSAFSTGLSGDISQFVMPPNLIDFRMEDTSVSYGTGGFLTGQSALLTSIQLQDCGWSEVEVDQAIADCVASGMTGKSINLAGTNAAPSAAGLANRTILLTRGWTVTVTW